MCLPHCEIRLISTSRCTANRDRTAGFFWFYFFNEHILRFLNLRYPRDYDTVPRGLFWLLHLAWFFPWSAFLLRAVRLPFRGSDRGVAHAAACALLDRDGDGVLRSFDHPGILFDACVSGVRNIDWERDGGIGRARPGASRRGWRARSRLRASARLLALLWASRGFTAPGDISQALAHNPGAYTLSLGHMGDLTLQSFAYLRLPLVIAAVATLIGAAGAWLCARPACGYGAGNHDGALLPGRAAGADCVRSLSWVVRAGPGAEFRAAWTTDCGRSVL